VNDVQDILKEITNSAGQGNNCMKTLTRYFQISYMDQCITIKV